MSGADRASDLISTQRLILVPLTPGDAEEMVDVLGDQRLYEFIGGHPPTLAELSDTYAQLAVGHSPDRSQEWRNWIVRRRSDGQAVGTVQATIAADGDAAEVAWVVGTSWQRQGIASEAARALVEWLQALGVETIAAHVHPAHHASAAVAARAGLTPTGTYHDGEQLWRLPVASYDDQDAGLQRLRAPAWPRRNVPDHERLDPEIAGHYAGVPERERLTGPGSLERVRTWELLTRHLPPPPAVVLDVGGAAGVYALPLAAGGYQVHLVDPVARHVEQALEGSRRQPAAPLAGATVGDARRLERPDASVAAALLLGPLYHLTDRADRVRALGEARRVVRPGGVVVAAAISRFGSTYDGLHRGYLDEPGFEAIVERDVREGQHRNPTGRPEWFTTSYFHLPGELAKEVTDAGLRLRAVLAVEGPGWLAPDLEERLADPVRRERFLAAIRRVEAEPSLLGASGHLLAIAHP